MNAVTAAEACKKLCPFKLAGPMAGDDMLCDATLCMGWLWADHEMEAARVPPGTRPRGLGWTKRAHVEGGYVWVRRRADVDRVGICGACNRRAIAPVSAPPPRLLAQDEVEPA